MANHLKKEGLRKEDFRKDDIRKEDLRIIKTNKALTDSMAHLLEHKSFSQITVNDICEEALISRAAFYYHFKDKYDLLKYSLKSMKIRYLNNKFNYEKMETEINTQVSKNSKLIKNLVENADSEVIEILQEFMLSAMEVHAPGDDVDKEQRYKYVMFSNFCAGGFVNFLEWQVKNKFPMDFPMMNNYLYEIVESLSKWYSD